MGKALNAASTSDIIDLAGVLGLHSMMNQEQYHSAQSEKWADRPDPTTGWSGMNYFLNKILNLNLNRSKLWDLYLLSMATKMLAFENEKKTSSKGISNSKRKLKIKSGMKGFKCQNYALIIEKYF